MLKKIFSFFGFTLLYTSDFETILKSNEILANQHKDFFDFKKFKPSIEFKEYCAQNNLPTDYSQPDGRTNWSKFWREHYEPHHIAYIFRKLSLHPELLTCFLAEFAKFDWEKTRAYMEKTNWCYGNNEKSPTIEDLYYSVISLVPVDSIGIEKNTVSSGGFEVALYYAVGKPTCEINFREEEVRHIQKY